jgi:hypothetical protein
VVIGLLLRAVSGRCGKSRATLLRRYGGSTAGVRLSPNEIYYQTGKDTILYQSTLHREFSDRAFNLLNLSVAILVAVGVVINIRLNDLEWNPWLIGIGILLVLAFLAVAVLCLSTLSTRNWYAFPPLDELHQRIDGLPVSASDALHLAIGNYLKSGADRNQKVLSDKAKAIFWAVLALASELIAAISLLALIFGFGEAQIALCDEALALLVR